MIYVQYSVRYIPKMHFHKRFTLLLATAQFTRMYRKLFQYLSQENSSVYNHTWTMKIWQLELNF